MRASVLASCVLIIAGLAGWIASVLELPLAWVLAPMLVVALASMSGLRMPEIRTGRRIGQLIVGSAIGLTMTPEAAGMLVLWSPLMVLTALVAIGVTVLLTVPFARLSGQGTATAFFSLTPGGLSEMAHVGAAEGARTEVVALAQAVRVAVLVTLLPLLLRNFGEDGGLLSQEARLDLPAFVYAGVLLACLVSIRLVRYIGANNPWMIGALLAAALLAGSGLVAGRTPAIPFALGQYLIGISIGARFERERMKGILRILGLAMGMVLVMSLLLAGYAWLLSRISGQGLSTTILLTSPGGMAEMALTATALHLNVMLVAGFHFVRSFIVNAYVSNFYRLFLRWGVFGHIEQLLDRLAGARRR